MFSNIKGLFSSNYVGVVTRHRDAICVRLTFSHLMNIFSPQPDYEQQLIEESRFRQQLEARNNKSKKNTDRKHGEYFYSHPMTLTDCFSLR